ncbi:sulfur carrier protein ThiS [Thioalkalivibrio paradoxus]|uniref:Sulfur carrier protein ThiS n=1 Tax=Thioalkalivibrio paradoxus ARh 1 TaxID=713585 RepID=W0DEP4_9GAMM|nr:sulfur carrier protein ThiS [Thioalkalivibrio paradoxus]AHE97114.1 sulfur carrier protein ThiS [Thioalkalivibrio paradoxus ARh 1]
MQILLNGEPHTLASADRDAATLGQLVSELGLAGRRLAVEVNGELVPRGEHATFRLSPGDRVEIVQAIGGG